MQAETNFKGHHHTIPLVLTAVVSPEPFVYRSRALRGPTERLGDLQTLTCAPVVRPKQCPASLNPALSYQAQWWSVSAASPC